MKKGIVSLMVLGFLGLAAAFLSAQNAQEQGQLGQDIQAGQELLTSPPEKGIYDPTGRRDPFINLLAGREIKDKTAGGGIPQIFIDDVTLVGIVKSRQKLTAIVSAPQGFPYFIKAGDKFSDGYVLSINEYQVVFRKTNERGFPLLRPKDIIKEINPEER